MSRGGATRFAAGQSGNLKGRPKKTTAPNQSAFDIVIDRTLSVTQNGEQRELTIDEALQQRTYQDAIKGSRSARREVLKMIAKREEWIDAKNPSLKCPPVPVVIETEALNANGALLLLGIAAPDTRDYGWSDHRERLLLEPWAVQAGLKRSKRHILSDQDLADIRRCTRDPKAITWP